MGVRLGKMANCSGVGAGSAVWLWTRLTGDKAEMAPKSRTAPTMSGRCITRITNLFVSARSRAGPEPSFSRPPGHHRGPDRPLEPAPCEWAIVLEVEALESIVK